MYANIDTQKEEIKMELKELNQIVEDNFYERFDKEDYKLILLGGKPNINHQYYIVVRGSTLYISFSVSDNCVFEAQSNELLSSAYDTKQWYYFITNVKEALRLAREKENA